MIEANDFASGVYAMWRISEDAIRVYEEGSLGEGQPPLTYEHLVAMRTWVFRMISISMSDSLKLYTQIKRRDRFPELWQDRDLKALVERIDSVLKRGNPEWIHNLRHKSGAHIEPEAIKAAILSKHSRDPDGSARVVFERCRISPATGK